MTLTNFFVALYFICGLLSTIYIWHKDYNDDYKEARKTGEVQEAMACLLVAFIFFLWPIIIIYKLIKKLCKILNII